MLDANDKNRLQDDQAKNVGGYYEDMVNVTLIRLIMELVKTLMSRFTSIDLSCNKFEGSILEEIVSSRHCICLTCHTMTFQAIFLHPLEI